MGSSNYYVEIEDGTRRKIARNKKLQLIPLEQAARIIDKANQLANGLTMSKAWELADVQELSTAELVERLLPSVDQRIGMLAVHAAQARERAYFSIIADRWVPISRSAFEVVSASMRKRQERRQLACQWKQQLNQGKLPEQLKQWLQEYLRGMQEANVVEAQFLRRYCREHGTELGQLLVRFQLVKDIEQWHLHDTMLRIRPEVTPRQALPALPAKLTKHSSTAFAIDSADTVEVDDAFSVAEHDGVATIGIHIAAPGLGLDEDSATQANERMVSVYLAGRKFPMLPRTAYRHYSLDAGKVRPCLSLLIKYDVRRKQILQQDFQLGQITVVANLPLEKFTASSLCLPEQPEHINHALEILGGFTDYLSTGLKTRKQVGHLVSVNEGVPIIYRRVQFVMVDALIEKLMKYYNTQAATYLQAKAVCCLVRDKGRLLTDPGNRRYDYGWFTSPLRRIVDLYNQQQLLAELSGHAPPHQKQALRTLIPVFDRQHNWARMQQRKLSTYWSLLWMSKREKQAFAGTATAENLIQLYDVPVSVQLAAQRLKVGTAAKVKCTHIDLYQLKAQGELVS